MFAYKYSRWDGTQGFSYPHPEDVIDAVSDDFLLHGDIRRALQQLLQKGMVDRFGQKMEGIQDLFQRLRNLSEQVQDRYNLGSVYKDIKDRLDEVVKAEREGIQGRLQELQGTQGQATEDLHKMFQQIAQKNLSFLDNLPKDPGSIIKALRSYDFLDQGARQKFQDLLEMLQRAVLESFFQNIYQGLQGMTKEDMEGLRRMVEALNGLIEQRMRGETPDFQGFMEQFGHYFSSDPPASLEDLLASLQHQMVQMQSLLASMPQDLRHALRDLLNSKLVDEALQKELAQLAAYLDLTSPRRWKEYPFSGDEPLSLTEALRLMENLQQIDTLEKQLEGTRFDGGLDRIDEALIKEHLGEEGLKALEQLKGLAKMLEEAGYLEKREGKLRLTPRAIRRIGQKALNDIFDRIKKESFGEHPVESRGIGIEPSDETKNYQFGAPFFLHLEKTLMNALHRRSAEGSNGEMPLGLKPEDFEVYETEQLSHTATVLALDLSRSMPMRGNFMAAKKVALALNNLIRTQFPKDNLYLVGFSGYAKEVKGEDLPRVEVGDFGRGTNIQAALMLARKLLSRHKGGNRQVIMITDGEPTAYFESNGQVYIEFPPSLRVMRKTLSEVSRCAREGITINTFMLERSYYLKDFVTQMAKINHGRALFTSSDKLGQYILVDYMAGKRRVRR